MTKPLSSGGGCPNQKAYRAFVGRFSKKGWRDLTTGPHTTLRDIASAYQTDERYAADVIQLAFLAPDVTARILAGTQPFDLTLHALLWKIDLPIAWSTQARLAAKGGTASAPG